MTHDEVLSMLPTPPCAEQLGWQLLDHRDERGWVRIGFVGRPEFLNPAGRIQGGFLAAMLDATMGPAVRVKSAGAMYPSSIDMNVSFIGGAEPGPLYGEAEVVRLGKTVGFVQGHLMDAEGRVLARATSSVLLVPAQRLD